MGEATRYGQTQLPEVSVVRGKYTGWIDPLGGPSNRGQERWLALLLEVLGPPLILVAMYLLVAASSGLRVIG